jgi:hypothetical protein
MLIATGLTLVLASGALLPVAAFAVPVLADAVIPELTGAPQVARADPPAREAAQSQDAGVLSWAGELLSDVGRAYGDWLANRQPMDQVDDGGVDEPDRLAIPEVVLAAYRNAARHAPDVVPGCEVDWAVLAGIGRVESRHGLFHGDDTVIDTRGDIGRLIVGPPLDGDGVATIPDSDEGRWDRDDRWDRAVGPMQFIPSSWRHYGQDGNGDGVRDPHNVFDATLAAVDHLCSSEPGDLTTASALLDRALFAYNHSRAYVAEVRRWIDIYRAADAEDLSPATVASSDPARRNPFTGELTAVAFDGDIASVTAGSGIATSPATSAGGTRAEGASEADAAAGPTDRADARRRPAAADRKADKKPGAADQPKPKPKPKKLKKPKTKPERKPAARPPTSKPSPKPGSPSKAPPSEAPASEPPAVDAPASATPTPPAPSPSPAQAPPPPPPEPVAPPPAPSPTPTPEPVAPPPDPSPTPTPTPTPQETASP